MGLTKSIPFIATELRPLIRVDDHFLLGLVAPHRHEDGVQHDFLGERRLHRPTNHPPLVEIHHDREV